MAIPEEVINEIKAKTSILDIVSEHVDLKKRGKNHVGFCPFHREHTPSFTVYPDSGSFYCFGCGIGGDVIKFISLINNMDFIDSVKYLSERTGITLPETPYDYSKQKEMKTIYDINRETADYYKKYLFSEGGKQALDYLKSRGVSIETIKRFGLGTAPGKSNALITHLKQKGYSVSDMVAANVAVKGKNGQYYDRFRNRVMFPIINTTGKIIAFSGRAVEGKSSNVAKYINTAETPVYKKSENLFGLHFAKNYCQSNIMLVEGNMDVISLHQAGFENAVAPLGTSLTTDQANLLSRYTKTVFLAFDSDAAGQKGTERAIEILEKAGLSVSVIMMPCCKDPDEFIKKYGAERFDDLLTNMKSATDYRLFIASKGKNLDKDNDKIDYLNDAAAIIAQNEDAIAREVYIGSLCEKYGVSKEAFTEKVSEHRAVNKKVTIPVQKPRIELNAHSVYDAMESVITIKELVDFAKENGMPAIALTDLNCVQGFPEFERECKKAGIKPIYGAQVIHSDYKGGYPLFTTVLVKNQKGLKNLYHIISVLKDDGACKNVPISVLEKYREGLLFGAHDFDYFVDDEKLLAFYDYIEIDCKYLHNSKKEENLQTLKYAKEKGKPVVAVSCAKFIDFNGKIARRTLKNGMDFETDGREATFLFNTEDMSETFSYLGEDVTDVVINNTNKIAEQIEDVEIIPRDFHDNLFEDSYKAIKMFAEGFATRKYVEKGSGLLPAEIKERLDAELNLPIVKSRADELLLARMIVRDISLIGGLHTTRGTAASSFLAYCLGITDINPLPPHYYCPKCHKIEWVKGVSSGADLPDTGCSCGEIIHGDGMNIPHETFFGFKGDKVPDIDINCNTVSRNMITNKISDEYFDGNRVAVCGIVRNVSETHAKKLIADYEDKTGRLLNYLEKDIIIDKLTKVKQSDEIHPAGLFLIPQNKEILDFTPTREGKYNGLPISHFIYRDLYDTLYQFDILPVKHLDLPHELEAETGEKIKDIPLNSQEIFTLIKNNDLTGITEFDTSFVSEILSLTKPEKFSDLVKIIGLSHGTGTWKGNAKELLKSGVCTLSDIPATRDDVYNDLLSYGLEREKAFRYSETIRKGLIAKGKLSAEKISEFESDLAEIGMPDWYIEYCKKIWYLLPKAHACEFARIAVIQAWYKKQH